MFAGRQNFMLPKARPAFVDKIMAFRQEVSNERAFN